MGPSAGKTSRSTKSVTCTSAWRARSSPRRARWSMTGKHFFIGQARATRALAKTEAFERSRHDRKRVEMLFAHLKRILRLGRLRLRGPCGAQFEFTLAAIAQNLRRLAKLVARPPPLPAPCVA